MSCARIRYGLVVVLCAVKGRVHDDAITDVYDCHCRRAQWQ